jgi:hypothetical protein
MGHQKREKLRYIRDYEKLQKDVARTGLPGKWRDMQNGGKQYRTDEGGVLNWWPTGTILFQGVKEIARDELARAFTAAAKRRLVGKYCGQVFCRGMQSLYPDSGAR